MRPLLLPFALGSALVAHAQHEHHMPAQHQHADTTMSMSHAYSLDAPMSRNASGTAWLPDSTPMFGYMHHAGRWMLMGHGNVFLRYTAVNANNDGLRGSETKLDAPNWFMGMAQRRVGANGLLAFTGMFSLDPLTIGGAGYPLLFQTGETWEGEALIDHQHPHDFLSALSVGYTQRLAKELELTGYFGYPGEPALGPPAFMHRISSLSNPDAPLGHHWQDASHVTFGVGTLGLRYKWFRLEGSSFTGREPDEERFDFDAPRFDSWSARLSIAPSAQWSMQASTAFIRSPEALDPAEDVRRTTASIAHVLPLGDASLNSIAVWGLNDAGHGHREHSALLESAHVTARSNTYLRYEWIEKSTDELGLEEELGHGTIGTINTLTIGHSQRIVQAAHTDLFLGAQVSGALPGPLLEPFYGAMPISWAVYLRITPGRMRVR